MIRHLRTALTALGLTVIPQGLSGHEGHGVEASWTSVAHWVSSPFHLALIVMLVALAGPLVYFARGALGKQRNAPVVRRTADRQG